MTAAWQGSGYPFDIMNAIGRQAAVVLTAPQGRTGGQSVAVPSGVRCPQCEAAETREVGRFDSTACQSMWACNSCLEPFDSFEAI